MTSSALPRPSRFPWLVPAVLFVVILAALVAVVVLARQASQSDAPPQPDAFQVPSALPYRAFDVERSAAGALTLTSGGGRDTSSETVQVPAGTRVWFLEPATPEQLEPPLIMNVISIPNEVRNFTITLIAFAPFAGGAPTFDADFVPLADGFAGHETSRVTNERPVISGVLQTLAGRDGTFTQEAGEGTIYLDPGAPIRLLRAGTAEEIEPGHRVALHTDAAGGLDVSRGILVLTPDAE